MARKRIMYIELKTGYDGDGPAWISHVTYSKTEKSFHWRGGLLQEASVADREDYGWTEGNYFDFETGRAYWASGAKKNGKDRLNAGAGTLTVDEDVRDAYEKLIGKKS
jgi:hypothetical protein